MNQKNGRSDFVFHLSSKHSDVNKHKNFDLSEKIVRHHIDRNPNNDYPTNILLLNEDDHMRIHAGDCVNNPNWLENCKIAVSKSNKIRTKDPNWVNHFNEARNATLAITYPAEKNSEDKKRYFEQNPEMKFRATIEGRHTTAKMIINRMKELNLEHTNINYEIVRESFGKKGKHYVTFNYVQKNYPELVEDFKVIIIEKEYKSHNQLQAEFRANLIISKIKEQNLELTEENFDKINSECYNPKVRWSRKAIIKFNPTILDELTHNHKVKKVEFITLPEIEEYYDLTVDSKYPNFALDAGIFIHNSGVTKLGKSEEENNDNNDNDEDSLKQKDIVGDLTLVSRLFHQTKGKTYKDIINELYEIYNRSRNIHHIHFECIVSQMMWVDFQGYETLWRLIENRDKIVPTYYSIQTVPEKVSFLLGLGFSNPKRQVIKGIQKSGKYNDGILDKIMCGGIL
jgi:hypothetical protein